MITLYYAPGTCAPSVHVVLRWIGAEYKAVRVKTGDPDYLKINPLGAVPAMIDSDYGSVMTQNGAILEYLANRYPESRLGGDGDLTTSYEIDRWMAFLTGDLHPAYFPYFLPARYTTKTDKHSIVASKGAGLMRISKMLNFFNDHMRENNHVINNCQTTVDAYAFALVRWSAPLDDYPALKKFYRMMLDDEGVQVAMQEQGIKH